MPRPREYAESVQTQIRLAADVHEALAEEVEASGLSRRKIIDQALRKHLGMTGPKLRQVRPGSMAETEAGARQTGKTRVKPGLARLGQEFRDQKR